MYLVKTDKNFSCIIDKMTTMAFEHTIILQYAVTHHNKITKENVSSRDTYSKLDIPKVEENDKHYLHFNHHKGGTEAGSKDKSTRHQNTSEVDGEDYGKLDISKVCMYRWSWSTFC